MPVIHRLRIRSGHLTNTQLTSNLTSRRRTDSDQSALHHAVPIIIAIVVPLGIILLLSIYLLILQLSKRLNDNARRNERPRRKLRKRLRKRRSVERRIQVNDEPEDVDQGSIIDNDTLQDGINLSLLSTPHSTVRTRVESVSSAVSETFPLMGASTTVYMDSSPSPLYMERPTRTQLEELEQRVQRLEGRWSSVRSEEQESEDQSARHPPPEEQPPTYTSRPPSFVMPRNVPASTDQLLLPQQQRTTY